MRLWVEEARIPGAVLSVWQGGRPVLEASYGWAQSHGYGSGQYGWGDPARRGVHPLENPVPMSVETVFDLASVTKVMATTTAVALLVESGHVQLDEPVRRYLPDFTGDGKEEITLEHLLTHRSGLAQWKPVYYHADGPAEAYAYVRDLPLERPVGAERRYSDLGFMVLGFVVERAAGASLGAYLEREIYGPLRLEATGFQPRGAEDGLAAPAFAATSHGNPYEHRMVHDPDFGYRIEGNAEAWAGWRRYTLSGEVNDGNAHHAFGGAAGHAGLFSNAGELQLLLRLWSSGGRVRGRRYLSADVVDRFLESSGDRQALGWQLPAYAPEGAFAHTGFTGTFVLGDRATGLGIVLLTNRQNGGVDEATRYPDVAELQRDVTRALTGVANRR